MPPSVRTPTDVAFGPELADMLGTPFRPFRWFSRDGLALAGRDHRPDGEDARPPVVCLPGPTRCGRDFEPVVRRLVGRRGDPPRRVVTVDFRGCGASEWAPDPRRYTPTIELDDLLLALDGLGIERATLIGTSRGGIVAMLCGLFAPDRLAAVVLNDIGPVIEQVGLGRIAMRWFRPLAAGISWEELVEARIRGDGPLYPKLDRASFQRRTRRTYRDTGGYPRADWDPRLVEIFADPEPNRAPSDLWGPFAMLAAVPTLVVHGALSDVLSAETVASMRSRHPRLDVLEIPDQGHPPLLDDDVPGDRSLDDLLAFLDRAGV